MNERENEADSFSVDHRSRNNSHVDRIDTHRSISSLATSSVSLDKILQSCGDFGRFQFIHFFFLNFVSMAAGIFSFYYVFAAAEPNHRCQLPFDLWPNDTSYYSLNETHQHLINEWIPRTSNGNKLEKCLIYSMNNGFNRTLIECPNGWAYDRSIFGYTFTEEANFVCRNQSKKSWLATMIQCGGFSLLIIGSLADRYGRKRVAVVLTIFLFTTCLFTQIILQWIPLTMETKFILLLINQFASGLAGSAFCLIFILMLELTSSVRTGFTANLALIFYTVGEVLVSIFAYFTRDWQQLKWVNTIFIGIWMPYLYFMPESPLYLYSKGQYSKLETILRDIARQNRRKETDWYSYYQTLSKNQSIKMAKQTDSSFIKNLYFMFTHRTTLIRLWISALLGFTTLLVYIKISYGLAVINASPYVGIFLGAIVEAASYVTSSLMISSKLGRKRSFTIMMIMTIISIVLLPIVSEVSTLGAILVAQFGKYAISGAIAICWVFVPELFPTTIRSSANGFYIASSRIGAILTPIMNTSISEKYQSYSLYGSAVLSLLILLLTLTLPETKDKPMDSIEDYFCSEIDL